MIKNYILDTNVLLRNPKAIFAFEENNIIIPEIVLFELDKIKNQHGELGYNAREVGRVLNELCNTGYNLTDGVPMALIASKYPHQATGKLFVAQLDEKIVRGNYLNNDTLIIDACKAFDKDGQSNILVTQDQIAAVKANIRGLRAETFKNEEIDMSRIAYDGRVTITINSDLINEFYQVGFISRDRIESDIYLEENQFVVLQDESNLKHTALSFYSQGKINEFRYLEERPFGVTPKNSGQRFLQEALMRPASVAPLIIIQGPAGSAKTFYSLAVGLHKVMETGEYRKMLICRPNIKMDEDIGFLPGNEEEKLGPFMRPVIDNLEVLVDQNQDTRYEDEKSLQDKIQELFDRGIIVNQAVGFLRGRSIAKTWILIDEAQNLTPRQVMGIITRAGKDTKLILAGDPEQIDAPFLTEISNGLSYAADKMKGSPLCWQIRLNNNESLRSPLAQEASKRFAGTK